MDANQGGKWAGAIVLASGAATTQRGFPKPPCRDNAGSRRSRRGLRQLVAAFGEAARCQPRAPSFVPCRATEPRAPCLGAPRCIQGAANRLKPLLHSWHSPHPAFPLRLLQTNANDANQGENGRGQSCWRRRRRLAAGTSLLRAGTLQVPAWRAALECFFEAGRPGALSPDEVEGDDLWLRGDDVGDDGLAELALVGGVGAEDAYVVVWVD